MSKLAVIGAGSWGTALAKVLARPDRPVALWVRRPELCLQIIETGENTDFLPGIRLPDSVTPTSNMDQALECADTVLLAVPTQYCREICRQMLPTLSGGVCVISAAKGLETVTLMRVTEVIHEALGACCGHKVAVLSGPTFAREVASGAPAAIVIACDDEELATSIQHDFSGPTFRLYTNTDVVGVELAAALKNVIAIGAGVCNGLDLGSNAIAALITRGLAEITRLAEARGARRETLAGLAGMGDLVLTCTGALSRNRSLGIELARGRSLEEVTAATRMVAEGVHTTTAALALARQAGVEMPITEQMQAMLFEGRPPRDAVRALMERDLKSE